jgi:hypothetical protein
MDRSEGRLVLLCRARPSVAGSRAAQRRRRPVRVHASKGSDGMTRAPLSERRQTVEEPDLNPGGDPPDDDRNDEEDGSPVPDPTEETIEIADIPEAD